MSSLSSTLTQVEAFNNSIVNHNSNNNGRANKTQMPLMMGLAFLCIRRINQITKEVSSQCSLEEALEVMACMTMTWTKKKNKEFNKQN
jgi:hypothetical protein